MLKSLILSPMTIDKQRLAVTARPPHAGDTHSGIIEVGNFHLKESDFRELVVALKEMAVELGWESK